LCNGTTGTVVSLLFKSEQPPPSLPIAAVVRFEAYTGPTFNTSPLCVPIPPVTFEWQCKNKQYSRQQLPIKLSYALTIHKSQGQTLSKAVIDIGKSERVAGLTFVALSRLKHLTDAIIQPMTLERLSSIKQSPQLRRRLQEEERLFSLCKQR
jgi:ATP-dependent DNA helicase PIF1